jgi:hypothetical protein
MQIGAQPKKPIKNPQSAIGNLMGLYSQRPTPVRCPRTPVKIQSKSWMECNDEPKLPVSGEQVRSHRRLLLQSSVAAFRK